MSEVVRACFQGVQAPEVIKDRLREANKQCYCTWQTEIKENRRAGSACQDTFHH